MLSIQGLENVPAIRFVIAFAIIFVLLALFALILRRLKGSKLSLSGDRGRARQPRLGIVDVYDLDRQRQLILLRRDNVEHLLLVGGPNDVVVETNIVRAPGSRIVPTAVDAGEPIVERPDAPPPRPAIEPVMSRPELAAPTAGGEIAPFPSPPPARGAAANRNPPPMRAAQGNDAKPERVRATPTVAPALRAPQPPPAAQAAPIPAIVPERMTSDGDRAVLSGMARELEDALKRPQEAANRPVRPEIARVQTGPLTPRLEPAPPAPSGTPARTRPDLGPRFARPPLPAQRPAPPAAPVEPPAPAERVTTPVPVPEPEATAEPTPPVIALPAPIEPAPPERPVEMSSEVAVLPNGADRQGAPQAEVSPPSDTPHPQDTSRPQETLRPQDTTRPQETPRPQETRMEETPRPPDTLRPPETPPRSDPFSIEDIEAEFARLLGRPLDRRDKI